jgi:GT2 family glycosyltransferase
MPSKVDIIIVNWNTGELLNECLNSIKKYEKGYISSIIVVDNNSEDSSHICSLNYDKVNLISLKNNLGFAKACNIGAKKCKSDYFLFLNPDTRLKTNTLKNVIDFMNLNNSKNFGICGVQIVDDLGKTTPSCSRFPSLSRHFFYSIGLNKFFPRLGSPMREWSHNTTRIVDQVMGAFFLIRKDIFLELNGFDERFFIYYEEVDLSYRARQKNYKSIFFSNAQVYHLGGGSSRKVKAKRIFYSQRSRILYALKHFSKINIICTLMISFIIDPISRTVFSLLNLSYKNFIESWLSYAMLLRWSVNRFIKNMYLK